MHRLFLPAALLLLAVSRGRTAEPSPLAAQVREIFEAKCVNCHGAQLLRPKGDFGFVLDLQKVAATADYVVRGHPENSELYRLVFEEEMPGEDADVPPLTTAEKKTLKLWIEAGAPDDAPSAPLPQRIESPIPKPPLPTSSRALRWLGRFHPATTHFPIALLFTALLADALAWWSRRDALLPTVRFLIVLGGVGAVFSAALGWADAAFSSYSHASGALLWWHRWVGTGTAAWAVLCGALVLLSECAEGTRERQRLRGALLLGAALVGLSGFLGSALIYGLNHYAW